MPSQEATFESHLAHFCDEAAKRLGALAGGQDNARISLAEAGLLDAPPSSFIPVAAKLVPRHLRQLDGGLLAVPLKQHGLKGKLPSARAAMGLFILSAFATVAREHASQGTLWPFVREHLTKRLPIDPSVLPELFDGGDTPSPCQLVKAMIREAVFHYPVRHAIGVEGTQQWYLTIHLQYGFSDKHFEEAGDRWLAGVGLPHSVELLLGHVRLDGADLVSDRFRRYWNVLRAFHHGEVGPDRARAEVVSLGWLAGERAARLLKAIAGFDHRRVSRGEGPTVEPELLLLGNPLLWRPPDGTPTWLYNLQIPAKYPLHRDEYSVQVGARKVGSVCSRRESGGTKIWEGAHISTTSQPALPPVVVRVPLAFGPWREPSLLADGMATTSGSFALSEQQVLHADMPLVFSSIAADPTLWHLWDGGRSVNEVVLAIPPALAKATPNWAVLHMLTTHQHPGWRVWVLRTDPEQALCLTIDSQVVWEFELPDPTGSGTAALQLTPAPDGDAKRELLRLRLAGLPGAIVEAASCAGEQLSVVDSQTIDVPLACFGAAAVAVRLRLKIALNGTSAVIHRTAHFPHPCLRVDAQSGLRRIDPLEELYLSDFNTVRFWHPAGRDAYTDQKRSPYLFEGRRPAMPAKDLSAQRGYRLQGRLAGGGDPLFFGEDLIPHDGGNSRNQLAARVIACGILNGIQPDLRDDGAGKTLLFEVEAQDIEPRPEWRIELLCLSGLVVTCSANRLADLYLLEARALGDEVLPALDEILAARIVIDGCVRGRWERSGAFAQVSGSPLDRWRIALEWELAVFRLTNSDRASLTQALLDSPAEFLDPVSVAAKVWRVHPLGQPGLVQRELLKRLVANATFDMAQADRFCGAIADRRLKLKSSDPERLVRSLVESASISPYLPYRLIEALRRDPALLNSQAATVWRRKTSEGLRAGMSSDAFLEFVLRDPDPVQPWRLRSPIAAAQVDAGFVDSTLTEIQRTFLRGNKVAPLHRDNLDALCELTRTDSRLARLAAVKLLE
jgi:hypothetical protein